MCHTCGSLATDGRTEVGGRLSSGVVLQSLMTPPDLDEAARAALRDAAKLAGNPALVPELERLVTRYIGERATGPAPQMCSVRRELYDLARQTERLRRRLEFGCWRNSNSLR